MSQIQHESRLLVDGELVEAQSQALGSASVRFSTSAP